METAKDKAISLAKYLFAQIAPDYKSDGLNALTDIDTLIDFIVQAAREPAFNPWRQCPECGETNIFGHGDQMACPDCETLYNPNDHSSEALL